jgi:LPXTG-motif cell wall-anchored protein
MKISAWVTGAMQVAVFSAAFAFPGTGIAMAAGPISTTSGNPGGTTSTSGSSAAATAASSVGSSSGGLLPTTGADLAGMLVAGLGAIGAGAVSMVAIRRRRAADRD